MSGNSRQDRIKAEKRAADMSAEPKAEPVLEWKPAPDECLETQSTYAPPDGSLTHNRIIVRTKSHVVTDEMVEFAVIQQTKVGSSWRDVMVADSCHDDEVHLHNYGRSTDERIGEPVSVAPVTGILDIANGYDAAYGIVVDNWTTNLARWRDG